MLGRLAQLGIALAMCVAVMSISAKAPVLVVTCTNDLPGVQLLVQAGACGPDGVVARVSPFDDTAPRSPLFHELSRDVVSVVQHDVLDLFTPRV